MFSLHHVIFPGEGILSILQGERGLFENLCFPSINSPKVGTDVLFPLLTPLVHST